MNVFLISLLLPPGFLCLQNVETAMKNILEHYKYRDPNCTFNHTEINSKTIEFFPKCKNVYGIIVINENTDLTPDQLQPVFKNMVKLFGGMRFENTKFTNISIFSPRRQLSVYCDDYGLYILNNTDLYDGGGLWDIVMLSNSNSKLCDVRIEQNPKLDMKMYCTDQVFQDLKGIRTKGNFKECDCEGDQITSENLPSYQNCTKLNYGLKLFNITDTTQLSFLSNVKQINGFIDIENTNIQDFSFLPKLRFWKVQSSGKLILNIQNNPNMTRLPFGFFGVTLARKKIQTLTMILQELENIQYQADVFANFENLHPDFCFSIQEFIEMTGYSFSFIKLHAKLCKDHGDLGENVLCSFKSMKELPNNCNILLGDLVIENGDEALMRKLINVEYLFGSVIIRNTELKTFENLGYMLSIFHLDESKPLIQILSNKVLRDANIPSLSYVAIRETRFSIIQDNNPARSANYPDCIYNSKTVNSTTIDTFPTTCSTVCADIYIDRKWDLTENQLTSLFKNMKKLIGRLGLSNTTHTSMKFVAGLESIECDDKGMFYIVHNSQLVELGLLNLTSISCPDFFFWDNDMLEKLNSPNWRVIETPKNTTRGPNLNFAGNSLKFCLTTREMRMFMHTNEKYYFGAIFCEPVFDEKLCNEPKIGCLEVFGDVEIIQGTNLENFKTVEIIYGSLNVSGTNLTDFSFLESLMYVAQLYEKPAIFIENNPNLVNITFPVLKKIRSRSDKQVSFVDNNRILSDQLKFCTGFSENMKRTMVFDDSAMTINGETCSEMKRRKNDQKLGKLSRDYESCISAVLFMYFVVIN